MTYKSYENLKYTNEVVHNKKYVSCYVKMLMSESK